MTPVSAASRMSSCESACLSFPATVDLLAHWMVPGCESSAAASECAATMPPWRRFRFEPGLWHRIACTGRLVDLQ